MRLSKRFAIAASAALLALSAGSAMADGEKIVIATEGAYRCPASTSTSPARSAPR